MARIDITVRGAGIFGLSIAWTALSRGARVRVIDPHGVGAGASGGIVGALQPHVPENWNTKKAFQLESLLKAEIFWREVDTVSGQSSGYTRVGRLQPLADARAVDLANSRSESARELWGDAARWDVVKDVGDWRPPSPTGLWIRDTLSAILHPRRACQSLAAAIRAGGGEIVSEGQEEGAVVWATGWAGLRDLSRALGETVGTGVKGQAILLDHDRSGAPQIFADALHIVPHTDRTVAVGSTTEREFDSPTSTDNACDALHARAAILLPELANAPVIERWAGIRPRAKSRAPLLGPWPGRPGHFVANGGFKIGFGVAPKVAEVMTGLVLDGKDTIPPDFRLSEKI